MGKKWTCATNYLMYGCVLREGKAERPVGCMILHCSSGTGGDDWVGIQDGDKPFEWDCLMNISYKAQRRCSVWPRYCTSKTGFNASINYCSNFHVKDALCRCRGNVHAVWVLTDLSPAFLQF